MRLRLDRGVQVDLHLAALRQDVDRAVLVGREVDPVRRRRRAELVHLFLQRGDLLARLVERVDELLVLVERLHELAIGLAQLVLEDHELLRRVLQLLAQAPGLGLERADVGLEILDLDLVLRQPAAVVGISHGEELGKPLHALRKRAPGWDCSSSRTPSCPPVPFSVNHGRFRRAARPGCRKRPQYRRPFRVKSSELASNSLCMSR